MPLAAKSRLGPYEVIAPIGEGGMGEVYRGRDTRLGRDVAIKILPPSVADDPDRLRRFEQEARAAGALNHPNILVVHDVGNHDRAPYLVCELLEGTTLREQLGASPLPARRVIDYAVQIANGLEKGPEQRFQSARDVAFALEGLTNHSGQSAAVAAAAKARPTRAVLASGAGRRGSPRASQ